MVMLHSRGKTKPVHPLTKSEELAEFIGILLGDGSVYVNHKHSIYSIRIASSYADERAYAEYIFALMRRVFGTKPRWGEFKKRCFYVCLDRLEAVNALMSVGVFPGNKKANQVRMPTWILENETYLRACLRGLFDTDGSVYRLSNKDPHLLRISFSSAIPALRDEVIPSLQKLGIPCSKPIHRNVFITRKSAITRYCNEIGFRNQKHLMRIRKLSSVV
ncbi:hypothetical protein HY492_03745 [Candidatus Woesearchaeota archaeon]|nr:hypothetical protein [Candidatus Woesearchaeota archaeon]